MSANQKETWEQVSAAPSYDGVDYLDPAHLAYIGLRGAHNVGVLIWQGDHLEFFTNQAAVGGWQGGLRQQVEDILRQYAAEGRDATEAWTEILDRCPVTQVEVSTTLGPLFKRIRESWAATS